MADLKMMFFFLSTVSVANGQGVASTPNTGSAGGQTVSIPFKLQDNLVIIDVDVNGRKRSAVLDSGSTAVIIDRKFSQQLGLRDRPSSVAIAGAGTENKELREVSLNDLSVGPVRLHDLPAYAIDLSHLSTSAGFSIDMLVGAPAFKQGAVTVDYVHRRVTFGPTRSIACAAPIPMEIVEDAPVVQAELRTEAGASPVRLKLMVDLGTRHYAAVLGGPFLRSPVGIALARSGVARQTGHGVGGKVQGQVATLLQLALGPMVFRDLAIALSGEVPAFEAGVIDGTIGVPLWGKGTITFDYPAGQLCIDTSGEDKRP